MLADSHCHLDWFKNPVAAVLRARGKGVRMVLSNSTGLASMQKNLFLSAKSPGVLCALGIHPKDLLSMQENEIEGAIAFAGENIGRASAVGEVGMDFKYAKKDSERALQERVFREFVSIAIKHGKPVVVHARYAETRCLDVLEELNAKKVHMHWFTNSSANAARAVSLGYFISCGPVIFSDSASAEVVKSIPLESLMLETDAPVSFGGKESGPSWIPLVCDKVAELKGVSSEEVSEATGRNFSALFAETPAKKQKKT